jgi:hypothetical protein
MNLYFLIYYRIYKATYKTNSIAEWTSMVVLSVLILLNLVTLLVLFYPNFSKIGISKNEFIAGSMCILVINYLIFISKQKYLKIINEYSKKKWANNFIIGVSTIFYIVGTVYFMLHVI